MGTETVRLGIFGPSSSCLSLEEPMVVTKVFRKQRKEVREEELLGKW